MVNFILSHVSLFFRMEKSLGLPFNILIEPTGNCNYRCVKCEQFNDAYSDGGNILGNKDLPFKYFCKIIDDIGDTLITLRLWHYGEPLLNKDIFSMVDYAKKKGVFVALSSNLSLLDDGAAEKMINCGLDYLIVSCDGASERTYNLYHGKDYFNKVVTNIEMLVGKRKAMRSSLPFIELQFIVMKENEDEVEKIALLARKLGVDKLTYLKLQSDRLDLGKHKGFERIEDILPKNKKFRYEDGKKKEIDFCGIPWEEAVIRYSGLVIPCAFDIGQLYAMGSVFHGEAYAGFRSIWNNDNYRAFRRQVKGGLGAISNCSSCEKRDNNNNDQIGTIGDNQV